MALICYKKSWQSEFDNINLPKGRVQDVIINQLQLKVNDAYKKGGKRTANFDHSDATDVVNRGYLDSKLSKNRRSGLL